MKPDAHLTIEQIRQRCGVYLLILAGEVVYVGKSTSIDQRVWTHRANGVVFDSFACEECKPEELAERETDMIVAYEPPYNETFPGNSKWITFKQLDACTQIGKKRLRQRLGAAGIEGLSCGKWLIVPRKEALAAAGVRPV